MTNEIFDDMYTLNIYQTLDKSMFFKTSFSQYCKTLAKFYFIYAFVELMRSRISCNKKLLVS